jgi:hypothetical protein
MSYYWATQRYYQLLHIASVLHSDRAGVRSCLYAHYHLCETL